MKKKILCLTIPLCMLLSGCSGINGYIEGQMLEKSGIQQSDNYQTYQSYNEGGKLTQQGYYSETAYEAAVEDATVPSGTAHVTFATNSYLEIEYFTDADHTQLLDTAACYLAPGSKIYAAVSHGKDVSSSTYVFSGMRIYQYDDGERELITTVQEAADGLVFEITDAYAGAELSVEPIGVYETRVISLRDYCTDDDGTEHDLPGTWMVDDKEVTENQAEISPVSSYIISYDYDSDEYFYVSSNPQCYYSNNEDGIVIFERRESTDETTDYSVELHKYVSISLETTQNRNATVNGGSQQQIKAGNVLTVSKLKYGDTVTIVTDKEWQSLENCRDLIHQTTEFLQNGQYRYTLVLPQKGGEFVFDPTEYTYEHGTIVFKCFGEVVTTTQYLAEGTKITYEAGTADEGYWLGDGDHVIVVGGEEETIRELKNIRFVPQVKVSVTLEQPEHGGLIRYFVDGKEISASTYQTSSGTEIVMKFFPWEGWINNYNNGETYTVTQESRQTALIGTKKVNTAFTEDPDHKPLLTVILDKSVGENMEFSFSASGLDKNDYHYESGWFRSNYAIIEDHKIGTETGIVLSMGSRAIQSGKAIKILIEHTDSSDNKTSYYRLVDDLTELQAPIPVYEENELGKSEVWYESIKITISVVDVLTFTAPTAPANATVTVRSENFGTLKTGDILEGSEKVTVTITPKDGYYVSGKNVKNDIYQSTLKFSKYQSDIQEILNDHSIEKYYLLSLTASDSYGVFSYELDGETISGNIRAKEGQKLAVEYKITASGYVIDGAKGFVFGIGKNDQEKTESIEISAELDGKTINRDAFGIVVVKGE